MASFSAGLGESLLGDSCLGVSGLGSSFGESGWTGACSVSGFSS